MVGFGIAEVVVFITWFFSDTCWFLDDFSAF